MAEAEVDFEDDDMEEEEQKQAPSKTKGRGHRGETASRIKGGGKFDSVGAGGKAGSPARSVEGWILFVTGVHEEAQEDDVLDKFADYGEVKNIHVNLDRRSGFVKVGPSSPSSCCASPPSPWLASSLAGGLSPVFCR